MTAQLNQPITRETVLLSFDVESNGLHGKAFAVGAVLMRADGTILDEFIGRSPIKGELDPWVVANVLPPMKDVLEDYKTPKALRGAFWKWFTGHKDEVDYVVTTNAYPVEARFLIDCQDDDIEARYWEHPFPILDTASLLIQLGIKPLAIRSQLVADRIKDEPELRHQPRWDAWVSAVTAIWALEQSGQLK